MIFKSTKEKKHYHLVYFREIDGENLPFCTFDDEHEHPVEINEETGEQILGEVDGHTHGLFAYEPKEPKQKRQTEKEKVDETMNLYQLALANEGDARQNGIESWEFHMCKQWKDQDKLMREQQGLSALTINETSPLVNLLVGHFIKNAKMPHFKPVENGDTRIADICNVVIRNIFTQSDCKFEDKQAWQDVIIAGRGNREVYVDTSRRVEGDVRIRYSPSDYLYNGPHKRLNQSDMEFLIKKEIRSENDLKAQFPEKAKLLDSAMKSSELNNDETFEYSVNPGRRYQREGDQPYYGQSDLINPYEKSFAVFELWKKKFITVNYLIDVQADEAFDLTGVDQQDVRKLETIEGVKSVSRKRTTMVIRKVAGDILLDEIEERLPDGINEFDVFGCYYKYREGFYAGLVEDIKDLQREINYTHSSATDVLRYTAGRNEVYDKDTFANNAQKRQYERSRNKHGALVPVNNIENRPIPKELPPFPADLINMEQTNSERLHKVANIPPEMAGQSIDRTSGKAMLISRSQALTGLQDAFTNWDNSTKRLVRYTMGMVKEIYSPERVMDIVLGDNQDEESDELSQKLKQYDRNELMRIWNDADLFDYDLEISDAQHTDTFRELSFMLLSEMAQQGVPIPPDEIIANSPLPNKQRIIGKIQEQQQAAMQQEQMRTDAEMMKATPNQGAV